MKRRTGVRRDRAAVNRLLGLIDDPTAHGRHAVDPMTGRVTCGMRAYKAGYAPCQLGSYITGSHFAAGNEDHTVDPAGALQ